jgi:insulysin
MIEFYTTYIVPTSPHRAKLAVYLVAQAVSEKPKDTSAAESEPETTPTYSSEPVIIEDVRDYRARLVASAGARPARQLSEFEDTDSKL